MKQKELTKTFMMISNWKNPFGLHGLYKHFRVERVTSGNPYNSEMLNCQLVFPSIPYHQLEMLMKIPASNDGEIFPFTKILKLELSD